jgi:hypothetical protein
MTKLHELASPVMGRATRFQANEAAWQGFEECQNILPPQRPVRDDVARGIHRVNLEDVLGQIEANGSNSAKIDGNIAHGRCSFR